VLVMCGVGGLRGEAEGWLGAPGMPLDQRDLKRDFHAGGGADCESF